MRHPLPALTIAVLSAVPAAAQQPARPAPVAPQPVAVPEPAPVGPSTGAWSIYGVPAFALPPGYVWYPPSVAHPVPGMRWPWHPPAGVVVVNPDGMATSTPAPAVDAADPLALLDAGMSDYRAGRYTAAKKQFEAAAMRNPIDGRAWAALAVVNFHLGNTAAAEEAALYTAAALRADPERAGVVYDSLSRVRGAARQVLTAAEDRVANEAEARELLGRKPRFAP